MPVFVEDPSQFSKDRLKSDLIAHNVALPPAKSKKGIYVELHMRHVDQKNAADFSSDEEAEQDVDEEKAEDTKLLDPSSLTDDCLKAALLKHGVKAGPIVASTRALYEKKLRNLLLSNGHEKVNGADEAVLYSDSENEEDNSGEENQEPDTEALKTQTEPADQDKKQVELSFEGGNYVYHQCFLVSPRLHACASKNRQPSPKRNSRNVSKSSQHSRSRCTQIPTGISRASSILTTAVSSEQQSLISNGSSLSSQSFSITQMVKEIENRNSCSSTADTATELNGSNVQDHWSRSNREPAQESFKDLLPDKDLTPTGIYATRRRPIKGAAGRPVQYVYRDTPVSPTTLERQEVAHRLVPLKLQIFVFLIVAIILYLIYVCVEDYSFNPLLALLDNLTQGLDIDEAEKQDTQEFLELDI